MEKPAPDDGVPTQPPRRRIPTLYLSFGSPRIGSGGPATDDVLKCQLTPLSAAEYPSITFTAAQWTTLQQAFPNGACNWKQAGVGQSPAVTWQTYQDANGSVIYGGAPRGAAPTSQPVAPANVAETPWGPPLVIAGIRR